MKTAMLSVVFVLGIGFALTSLKSYENISTNISEITYSDDIEVIMRDNYKRNKTEEYNNSFKEENLTRAKNIYETVIEFPYVDSAYIKVDDEYVFVGLELEKEYTNDDLKKLKKEIVEVDEEVSEIFIIKDKRLLETIKDKYKENYI